MEIPLETSDYPETLEPLGQVNSESAAKKTVVRAKTSSERTRDHLANERTQYCSVKHFLPLEGRSIRTKDLGFEYINCRPNASPLLLTEQYCERTYLAWMRTAIALTGFGVLIPRLRYLISPDTPGTGYGWALGLLFAGIGLVTVLLSTQHYFWVLDAIDADTYQPSKRWVIIFSLVSILLGTGVIYVILTMPSNLKISIF